MREHAITMHFDGLEAGTSIAATIAAALGGGFGVHWLRNRASRQRGDTQLNVRVFDEGEHLRAALHAEAKDARNLLAGEIERRHQAEISAVRLEAINAQLCERLARANDRIDSLTKMRGMIDPEASKAGG